MKTRLETNSNLLNKKHLTKNIIWNMLGLGTPLLAAVVAIPLLIEGMGSARFGVLTLAWMVLGYFSLFDFGLGRAITQLIAKKLGEDRCQDISPLFWTAIILMMVLGILGGIVVFFLTPWLVSSLLHIPIELQGESVVAFYLIALSIPIVVTTTGTRGVLEAYQYFGLVNLVRTPMGIFNFLGPLLVLPYSSSLESVVGILLFGRFLAWMVFGWLCHVRVNDIVLPIKVSKKLFRPLFSFGGWMTVTNIVGPLMVYIDRFVIASVMSVVAVAYYATPHEMVTKLGIIPTALLGVLFPAFATILASDRNKIADYFQKAESYLIIILFPIILVITLFSREILLIWIGPEYASNSAAVMEIFLFGVFVNSFARLPYTLIQSDGRPDITAKLHLLELIPYIVGLWFGVQYFGFLGAAWMWAFRIVADMLMLYYVIYYKEIVDLSTVLKTLAMILMSSAIIFAGLFINDIIYKLSFSLIVISLFLLLMWIYVLMEDDKRYITNFSKSIIYKFGI